MGPSPVLIVTGAPGVGKTTACRALAEGLPAAVHVEADRFFAFIRTGYVDPMKPESRSQNATVMGIAAAAAASYARAGYFTIIDGIVIPGWFLGPVRDVLAESRCPAAYAVLRAPLDECLRRAEARDDALGDPAVVEQLWSTFADIGDLEHHAVEVGDRGPAEVAGLLAGLVSEGRLAL